MTEPTIKGSLASPQLTGHPASVQERLNKCLASDSFNIRPHTSGAHVKVLHEVLRVVRLRFPELKLNEIKDKEGEYGKDTIAAVLKYKAARSIVRKGQPLDPIVGRMTLTAFDNDLLDEEPPVVISQDVFVHILGARVGVAVEGKDELNGQPEVGVASVADFDRAVNTAEYLKRHKPLKHLQVHGGQGKLNPTARIVQFIEDNRDPNGFIILIGLSSGGPIVTEVARALMAKNPPIPVGYLAILDGAFDNDADKRRTDTVKALKSDNFFQTLSNFAGQEFHGPVPFFSTNRDFSNDIEFKEELIRFNVAKEKTPFKGRVTQAFIEHVHFMAIKKGYPLAKVEALALLRP